MKRKRATYFLLAVMLCLCVSIFANQKKPPKPKPNQPDPPGLPIDGGVTVFLIVGAAYGIYGIKKIKN